MITAVTAFNDLTSLGNRLGLEIQTRVPLARYTAARVGGPAEVLVTVKSSGELAEVVSVLWERGLPFRILGGGSNMLVSDAGIAGIVILNHARGESFREEGGIPRLWAESGANFGLLARKSAARGLRGLEWAAGIPGTLGGAVVGNAGAHGQDMSTSLQVADILHQFEGRSTWPVERLEYGYRTSILKTSESGKAVVLAAELTLAPGDPEQIQARMEQLVAFRRRTQPPGASMGSMFKNPPGDYAGRLIEAAGLKGAQVGGARISELHANFFINQGEASAGDIRKLIELARRQVMAEFGVNLELEIELVGDWSQDQTIYEEQER